MRRNNLAAAILWAAVGFAMTGGVVFTSGIHADDAPKRAFGPQQSISTTTYTIAWRMSEQKQPELVLTNLTDQTLHLSWNERLQSTGKMSPFARMIPAMKDVSTEARGADVPPKATATLAVSAPPVVEPPAKDDNAKALARVSREKRQVVVEAADQSLIVPVIDQPVSQVAQQ